jgi:hypothetical protein
MRLLKLTRAFSTLSLAMMGLHCADPEQTGSASEPGTDKAECRSFAATGKVELGQASGALSCSFDPQTHRHVCKLEAGTDSLSTAEQYVSPGDFVEAGRHIGKLTSLSETRIENGVVRFTKHAYDELGRVTRSVEEHSAGHVVYAYQDYDAVGRPRRALLRSLEQPAPCGEVAVVITYADQERRVSRRYQAANAAQCGFTRRSVVEHYDALGNRVSIDEADGASVATRFELERGAKLQQVCL